MCGGCPVTVLCLKDAEFRRGRPFITVVLRGGELFRCRLLEDDAERTRVLERYYHRELLQRGQGGVNHVL